MLKSFIKYTFALFLLPVLTVDLRAQREQIIVGTRPLSMGEAFVAVADDGSAIYWNPAGLARMERIQASFSYADLFSLGIKRYYASFISRLYFIPPLTDYLTFGVDGFGMQFKDSRLDFARNQFNFSLAFKPTRNWPIARDFDFGINVKYLTMRAGLPADPELEKISGVNADGWGGDFGVLYNLGALPIIPQGLNLGLMIHDIRGTQVTHDTGVKEKILPQSIRCGLSYRPFEDWPGGKIPISDPVFAIDLDDRVHFGLEFWLVRALALRAGIQKDLHTDEKVTLSFGLGFKTSLKDWPEVNVDYALTDSPVLPNTNKNFGGSLIIRDDPRLIRIEGAQINNVFASLYRHYGQPGASIGSIKLKNVSDDTLIARIAFQASRYMRPQPADTVVVPPGHPIDFPLRAVFNSEILYAMEGRLTGEVKVIYDHKRSQHTSATAVDFALHGKHYLTWDDPGKVAAFATTDEPLLQKFVDQALAQAPELEEAAWLSRLNMSRAMIIFNALKAYGMRYRPDEVTPYPTLADTSHGALYRLDTILYPGELLLKDDRAGDCDDLSVLYAAMLQYAGLPTAFVTGRGHGHIFIMFDTTIPATYGRSLPVSPNLFVKRNGTLWIPIETTMMPTSTFSEAWTHAANVIDSTWQRYDMASQQNRFPPVKAEVLKLARTLPPIPDFTPALQKDFVAVSDMKARWLQAIEKTLEREVRALSTLEAAKARNIYGVLLGQNDEYGRAKEQLQKILAKDSTFAPAWNNLGNVEFITGNFPKAERDYKTALKHDVYGRGTHLNLAILYQMMKQDVAPADTVTYQRKSDAELLSAAQIFVGNSQSAFALLQFPEEERTDSKGDKVGALKKRIRQIKRFIDGGFKKFAKTRKIEGIAIDRSGAKGRDETDDDRSALLAWNY